jgi:hypothetical protein
MSNYAQGTVARMAEVARAEVGTIEGPKDNQTKYGAFTKRDLLPWCGSFLMWCGHEAGVNIPDVVSTADGAAHFKAQRAFYDSPMVGDLVFFAWDNPNHIQHVGLVIRIATNQIITVEGNTSATGSQHNGGQVMLKSRATGAHSGIAGYGRPVYKAVSARPIQGVPKL